MTTFSHTVLSGIDKRIVSGIDIDKILSIPIPTLDTPNLQERDSSFRVDDS